MDSAERTPEMHAAKEKQTFSGSIFIFQAFDVGEEVNLHKVQKVRALRHVPLTLPKYFKNYHTPLAVELPHPNQSAQCISCKIHSFGAISLTYQIPFVDTLDNLRKEFETLHNLYREQAIIDAKSVFRAIEHCTLHPSFFLMNASYMVAQIDPKPAIDVVELKKDYGAVIASMLRLETESLSEYQRNEILDSAIGYYRGDLIIVDTDATFLYDAEYSDVLDFFEFANIQQLELRYFDRLLDQELNKIYEAGVAKLTFRSYLPFMVPIARDPVTRLGKLKVDISVITERLESSIKIAGEPYYSELYMLLVDKLDLSNWQHAIDRKLTIIHDIQSTYQNKIDTIREDLLSVLIILLIFIELVIGLLNFMK